MKGIYALGNTGNSLPVPEGQEALLKIYAHSKLLVLCTQTTSCLGHPHYNLLKIYEFQRTVIAFSVYISKN